MAVSKANIRPCGKPQGTVASRRQNRRPQEKQNKRDNKNEKRALYIKLYGDSGLPHGLWVRRFSGIWEEYVLLCG